MLEKLNIFIVANSTSICSKHLILESYQPLPEISLSFFLHALSVLRPSWFVNCVYVKISKLSKIKINLKQNPKSAQTVNFININQQYTSK